MYKVWDPLVQDILRPRDFVFLDLVMVADKC